MANMNIVVDIVGRDNASGPVNVFTKSVEGLGGAVQHAGGLVAGLTHSLAGIGLAGAGIKTIVDAGRGLADVLASPIQAASDLSESLNKVGVVFGGSSSAIEAFAAGSAQKLGISKQAALEATGTFGNLFTSLGLGQAPAADLSKNIVTLASDLASFNNIKPEEALEKLKAGLLGESEPLRSVGVNLSEAAVQAEALRLGLAKNKDEIDDAAKVQARYSLILAQTKNAQGDFANTSTGMANAQRIIAASMQDLQTQIGSKLLPAVAPLISTFAQSLPGAMDAAGPALDAVGKIVAGPVVDGVKSFVGALSGTWQPAPGIGQFADVAGRLGLIINGVRDGALSFVGALQGTWQPAPGIGMFADIAGRLGLIMGGVRDTVVTFIGALSGTWQPAPGIGQAQDMAGKFGLLLKDTVIPAVQAGIAVVQKLAADPMGALQAAFKQAQDVMQPFAPTADKIGQAVGAITTAVGQLVPEPLTAMLTGIKDWATSADTAKAGADLLKGGLELLVGAVNGTAEAVSAVIGFFRDNDAALSALVGVVAAITTGYALATAVTIAHTIATGAQTIATGALSAAQGILNAVMSANPIGLVVIAIAGLAAGLVFAYNKSETFRSAVDGLWASITTTTAAVVAFVTDGWNKLSGWWNGDGAVWRAGIATFFELFGGILGKAIGLLSGEQDSIVWAFGLGQTAAKALTDFLTGAFSAGVNELIGPTGALGNLLTFLRHIIDAAQSLFSWLGKIIGRQSQVETPPSGESADTAPTSQAQTAAFSGSALTFAEPAARLLTLPAARSSGRGGDVYNLTLHVAGSVVTEKDLVNTVWQGLLAKQRRDATLGFV